MSIFLSSILFIRIINETSFLTDTRETAIVNSLLAAGAGRRIAAACRDEKLANCTCKVDGTNGVVNNTYITYDCSYNGDVAEKLMLDFFEESNTTNYPKWSIAKKVENRNHKIGFNVSNIFWIVIKSLLVLLYLEWRTLDDKSITTWLSFRAHQLLISFNKFLLIT